MHTQSSASHPPLNTTATVGVVGAGIMGSGIAQVAASAGHPVLLYDHKNVAVEWGLKQIRLSLQRRLQRGKLSNDQVNTTLDRITPITDKSALQNCQLIIEAVSEDQELKQSLLQDLERYCSADCILATNTSSLSVSALAANLQQPQRFAGMHFFNPAPIMKLVEVVSGLDTSEDCAAVIHATAKHWGKQPVRVQSSPGFIVNRIARPFYAEALQLLDEGASDIASLDYIYKNAGRFPMGPFELMDLIGHDTNYAVTSSIYKAHFDDPRFQPSLQQKSLIDSGRLGRKSGRGFYDYKAPDNNPKPNLSNNGPAPNKLQIASECSIISHLVDRIEAAGVITQTVPSLPANSLKIGSTLVALTDGRTATEIATDHAPNIALFDLALDYDRTECLAISFSDQCGEDCKAAVCGLFSAISLPLCIIDDTPGLVVMRTVAMLANTAADALQHKICSVEDADLAMRSGLNFPLGPLQWAEKIGLEWIYHCLHNLQVCYGSERYRPSLLLRRKSFSGEGFYASH